MSFKKMDSEDIVSALVKNIIAVDYKTLPAEAVDMTKKQILDALACMVAGSSGLRMKELVEIIGEWGRKEESTIVIYGRRVPSPSAALANATMGSIWDFDDNLDIDAVHAEVPVVAAGFATAEQKGAVGGQDLIAAVTLGMDLGYRLKLANTKNLGTSYGWDFSCTHGFFSAAATSAKILGLDENKLRNALGIAYHQAGGAGMGMHPLESASTKELGRGFAAQGGVVAASLADRGFTGMKDFLMSRDGLYNCYMRGDVRPEILTKELGETFMGVLGNFKPYSSCRNNHTAIDATLALVKEHDIKPEDVEEIIAYVGKSAYDSNCAPLEMKQSPSTAGEACFSVPWVVATVITYHNVEPKDFTEEAIKNRDVLNLAHKVTPKLTPEFGEAITREPVIIEIKTKGKKNYSKRIDHCLGSTENPFSMEDIIRKFRNCATSYSAKPIPSEKVDEVVQMVQHLENVTDVSHIIRLLV